MTPTKPVAPIVRPSIFQARFPNRGSIIPQVSERFHGSGPDQAMPTPVGGGVLGPLVGPNRAVHPRASNDDSHRSTLFAAELTVRRQVTTCVFSFTVARMAMRPAVTRSGPCGTVPVGTAMGRPLRLVNQSTT